MGETNDGGKKAATTWTCRKVLVGKVNEQNIKIPRRPSFASDEEEIESTRTRTVSTAGRL